MKLRREGDEASSQHSFIDHHTNIARFRILSFGKGYERNSDFSVDVDLTDVLRAILHMSTKDIPNASKIEALLRRDQTIAKLFVPLDIEREAEEQEGRY